MSNGIPVMFCWNGNRGLFSGRLEKVDFQAPRCGHTELEGVELKVEMVNDKYRPTHKNFRISRGKGVRPAWEYFRVLSHVVWMGNWHWDQCRLTVKDFVRLLEFLRGFGWGPICGAEEFWNAWESAKERPDAIREWVEREWKTSTEGTAHV